MHDIIKMCSFETTKSTKGASKMRRDLLNSEISQLRDLLPLPPSTRQRLSQLQLMALVCVYVRKSNYFQQAMKNMALASPESPNVEFLKAMSGFLMMMTQGGKLLYISDNAAEYLGHSMEDLLIHGDSVFDIIDKQDHGAVQAELIRGAQAPPTGEEDRMFLCRMNVSRNARRQMRFGDQKVVLVQGHFLSYLPLSSRNEPVFLAQCTPVAMPETRESVVQGATNVFTSVHTLDMKLVSIDKNGEFYLGYSPNHLAGVSWYHLLHPDNLKEAQMKHRMITSSEQDRSCIMLIRLQTAGGSWRWIHCVLQVKESADNLQQTQQPTQPTTPPATSSNTQQPSTTPQSPQPVIVATNQVLGEKEAAVLRANSWLYNYYAMQSKLQYGLSYEAHAQRMNSYYPQVPVSYQPDTSAAYMSSAPLTTGSYPQAYPTGHSSSSAYPLSTGSSYLQSYPHPYSMRLPHGLDYAREQSWNYYNSLASMNNPQQNQFSHPPTPTASPQQTKGHKRPSSASSSPRRSPQSTASHTTDISDPTGGTSLATPVAVRATITAHPKLTPPEFDDSDASWKSSPQQEVPDYPEFNPFIPTHYGAVPQTKLSVFAFESSEMKDVPPFHDHHVPSVARDTPWYSHAFVR